jgi:DNA-binding LacI/PurR family transcriptional regulator/DNA-binding transcriptional regulator YhcF (GntR family)
MSLVQKACATIRARLDSGEWQSGQRLPSLNRLARLCMVSRSTMWQALRVLQAECVVHTHARSAIYAGSPAHRMEGTPRILFPSQQVARKLRHEILQGKLSDARLSSVTRLAREHGVTRITVRKALRALEGDSLLVTEGRRFRLAPVLREQRSFTTLFISYKDEAAIPPGDSRIMKIIEHFERECHRLGFHPLPHGFDDRDSRSYLDTATLVKRLGNRVNGCIVCFWCPPEGPLLERWTHLFTLLLGARIPLVVIDLLGRYMPPAGIMAKGAIRVLRPASERAGETIIHLLLRRGHRCIAYVTPHYGFEWARARYRGMCAALEKHAEARATSELFMRDRVVDQNDMLLAYLHLSEEQIRILFGRRSNRAILDSLGESLARIKGLSPLPPEVNRMQQKPVRAEALRIIAAMQGEYDPRFVDRQVITLSDRASTYALEDCNAPLFAEALRKSKATAWVVSDDKTALMALDFLHRNGIQIPKQISLIGFDSVPDAFAAGLSSYDFNYGGLAEQAMMMLVDQRTFDASPLVSEVDGYVVERMTTKR